MNDSYSETKVFCRTVVADLPTRIFLSYGCIHTVQFIIIFKIEIRFFKAIIYILTSNQAKSEMSITVADEGNKRIGDMTKDELQQCVFGNIYSFFIFSIKLECIFHTFYKT